MNMQTDDFWRTDHADADQPRAAVGARPSADDERARAEELENELEKFLSLAQERGKANAALRHRVLQLEAEVAAMRQSTSWRVTAPIRAAVRSMRATRFAASTVRRQMRSRGGLKGVLELYVSIIRREGWAGIAARIQRLRNGGGFASAPPSAEIYGAWIEQYDSMTPEQAQMLAANVADLARKPLISIVVPAYNSDEALLREMIDSVKAQIYPHWELCIADDASTQPHVRRVLESEAAADSRIKVTFREQNGHISEASNSALELATGEFVALLDHDDILPAHALYVVARYINLHPTGRLFYSDEDKLDEHGARTTPYFKSDWNPFLFLAHNMFSHLGVYETALVREAGGFRKGYEGSQDYDLALRCVDIAGDAAVVHIPHVLYHWRIVSGSTAGSGEAKPYAQMAAVHAVEDHFARRGIDATIERSVDSAGTMRVRYALPEPQPLVSIIIPTRDGRALLEQCINSVIRETLYRHYEIIVVDNGSVEPKTFEYFEQISAMPNVSVIRDDSPFNFSALNNRAVGASRGEFVCLMNNDIEVVSPDWLDEMMSISRQPGVGAVGACLWYPNNTLQHGGVVIGLGGIAGHMHHKMGRGEFGYFGRGAALQNVSAVTAACLVVRKSIYEEVGGLDPELAVAFNDVDFCLKIVAAGYRNVWTPHAELYHHESATRGSDLAPEKYQRFLEEIRWMERRWNGWFERDPAYSPNLTLKLDEGPFALAFPPRIGQFE